MLNLNALASVGKSIRILSNNTLKEVSMTLLKSLGVALLIINNPALPTCQAEVIRDQLLANGYTGSVGIA